MYRKSKKLLVWCLVVSMVLTQMLFTNVALAATPNAGANRYETAAKVALAGWTTSDYAVLAYGEDFPDALAAAPLAAAYGAPILLTNNDKLDTYAKDALVKLGVKNVIIVGGEGVVPAAIATEVAAMTGMAAPTRVFGAGRVETALAIAKAVEAKTGVAAADVFVVNSEVFADALSVSSLAAMAPITTIVLVGKDEVSADVLAYVGSKKAYVIGGEGAVSAAVMAKFASAERVTEGTDRYGTNLAVLKTFADFKFDKVFVATGENYPDALAGSVYAAKFGSPLVLVDQAITADTMAFLKGKMTTSSAVYTLGGLATVASAASALETTVNPPSTTFGVESVSAVDLNTVKVVFTKEVNETNAENTANYMLGTSDLGGADAAILQADKKTVYVLMNAPQAQSAKAYFTVKSGILSKAGNETTSKVEKELTFSDVTAPAVEKVEVTGNKTLTVYFGEAVLMTPTLAGLKIDGVLATSFGANGVDIVNPGATGTTGDEATTLGYAKKLVINFGTALPAGAHTLTVPAGNATDYVDAAGFRLAEAAVSFNVEAVTGAPSISSVTGSNNGTVYVQFNRDMEALAGTNGAENRVNYSINGVNPTSAAFDTGSKSKVKLVFSVNDVAKGANVLVVDKDIKDAFGNLLNSTDDQRVSFVGDEDKVAPTVQSVTLTKNSVSLDDTEITVKFSETVAGTYATNPANYTLKDADGNTVGLTGAGASILNSTGGAGNDDTFIINLPTASSPLAKASYTLKIKNVVDTAATPNAMAEVIMNIAVSDAVAPTVTAYETAAVAGNKVRVVYSEAMDASIMTKANYYYVEENNTTAGITDGADKFEALPSSVTMAQIDSKTVELVFPSTLDVAPGSATNGKVVGLKVIGVKDASGNLISGGSALVAFTSAAGAANVTIDANTVKVEADSNHLWVTFNTNQILSTIDYEVVNDASEIFFGGQAPDSAVISGKTVTLDYTGTAKIDAIKLLGNTATLATAAANTQTVTAEGVELGNYSAGNAITVYENAVAPKIASVVAGAVANQVVITFTAPIITDIAGLYKDDFTVESNGALVTVNSVAVSGGNNNVLTLTLASNLTATATVKAIDGKIDIASPKEGSAYANTSALYVPSSTDKGGRTITKAVGVTLSAMAAKTDGTNGVDATAGTLDGTMEVGTVTVNTVATTAGNIVVKFVGGAVTQYVTVAVATADTVDGIATKIKNALNANASIAAAFTATNGVGATADDVIVTAKADGDLTDIVITLE